MNGRKEASYISVATAISLLIAALGGGAWVGAIGQDVDNLKKSEVQAKADHDTVVTLKADVKNIKDDVEETKRDVKSILKALKIEEDSA